MQVLSYGQCAADRYGIERLVRGALAAEVTSVNTAHEALDALRRGGYALVLVNRVPAYGGSGLELIARLKSDPALGHIPVMLVSDLADAQREAEALGAVPGFGKAQLSSPATRRRLEDALIGGAAREAG